MNRTLARSWMTEPEFGEVEDMVNHANKRWLDHMERLNDYRTFLETYGYTHLLGDPERLIYAQIRSVNDVRLAIAGFNTAWACGKKEENCIWFGGRPQFDQLEETIDHAQPHLKIALMHHPTRWIHGAESAKVHRLFTQYFDFWLHGHEHLMFLEVLENGHHRLAAGATYQGRDEENTYNIARINLDTRRGRIWMRQFATTAWVEYQIPPYTDRRGVWRLNRSLKFAAERFRESAPAIAAPKQAAALGVHRLSDGRTSFLLTLTRNKRWLFPKGRLLGERPLDVATRRARDEAGATGTMQRDPFTIFDYRHGKGAAIPVAVYLFEVEHLLSEEAPDFLTDAIRTRRPTWYTAEQAMEVLKVDRQPDEWEPLVEVIRKAAALSEGSAC